MITQKTVSEVLATARIEDVVADFVSLRRRGVNLIGNCPFHDEKTPSFSVNPSRNIFKCFGCGKAGDPVKFIMEHEKLSFPESVRFLAHKYNIEIEETINTAEEIQNKQTTDSYYIINDFARDYYADVLFNRQEGRQIGLSYFKERGFLEGTVRKWQLGYATDERDAFTQKALNKKYNIDYLHALGLTSKSDLDFFRSRVMFTIHNVSGKVIAFAGRTLSADKKVPKYINSPESEIYNKRAVLYGLYFAKDAIRKADQCILVEGYTDVITMHQGGIENVVAASGTSLTNEQIRLIKRFTPNIKIIFDGDKAGVKAAIRGLDLVLEADMNVKLVLLPDSEDPDSFLSKKGPQGFSEYIEQNEQDFLIFKAKTGLVDAGNDPIRKSGVIKDMVTSISKIPDTFKRSLYTRQCADILEMSEEILVSEINKMIRADQKQKRFVGSGQEIDPDKESEEWLKTKTSLSTDNQPYVVFNDAHIEREVCSVLISYGDKFYDEATNVRVSDFILHNVKDILLDFDIPLYRKILETALQLSKDSIEMSHTLFTGSDDAEIQKFAVDVLSSQYVFANWASKEITLQTQKMPDENYVNHSNKLILSLLQRKADKSIKVLEMKVEKATPEYKDTEEYIIDLKVLNVLKQQRSELLTKNGAVVNSNSIK